MGKREWAAARIVVWLVVIGGLLFWFGGVLADKARCEREGGFYAMSPLSYACLRAERIW